MTFPLKTALLLCLSVSAIAQQEEKPKTVTETVTVRAIEAELEAMPSTAHGVVDGGTVRRLPLSSTGSGFTDLITRTTPGVAADSNGFAHPLGEHADTSVSLDGQPMTDQLAKIFANQIDPRIIDRMDAMTGAPPAEFGDKTSLVINVVTKSGVGRPLAGEWSSEGGSFATWSQGLMLSKGGQRWGEFIAAGAAGSNRFLDTPEFRPIHARGDVESVFNRFDWNPHANDLIHWNVGYGRSAFQTPNSFDTEAKGQQQRSLLTSGNLAMGWTHVVSPEWLVQVTPFVRVQQARYLPSPDEMRDQTATLAQDRSLWNMGVRAETVYARGRQTLKAGGTLWQTRLNERFDVGLTDPLFNAVCVDGSGNAVVAAGVRDPQACAAAGYKANADFQARLLPYDLSRGGTLYHFSKTAGIAQAAVYAQEELRLGAVTLSAGLRYDVYDGLSTGKQLQPRVGIGWRVPGAKTLLRASYARLFETPYNENLIFANDAGQDAATSNPFAVYRSEPVKPGTRNQFNVGFAQPFGKYVTVDADYYWKFTHTAFDFDTLFNTPVTFSVAWEKSKIDGLALRVNLEDWHGVSGYSVMGHVRSRFFTPQVGGLIFSATPAGSVFRIDHGEEFEQTTALHYTLPKMRGHRPWVGFSWGYNSGLALPGTTPVYTDTFVLTGDEQQQMGLHCGGVYATPSQPIRNCSYALFGADRVRIPAPGTQDDDRNPVRVAPRQLVDVSVADDALWRRDRVSVGMKLSVTNLFDKVALYNFLSTFSGTHFVPPRNIQAGVTIAF
ncbi:TonB-dependent receptor plug domain-containing protein [Terriglobus tenax]|uniref:TonB-dependent receptor plug domain-containing protein n=1 Tax=Terriglobus tenax TaxID=1111115 RepID=UPI0021DF4713|nr:TonB-dependent receptor [Terriglobus tenax]